MAVLHLSVLYILSSSSFQIISILNSVPNLEYLDLNYNNWLSQASPPPPLSSLPATPLSVLTLSCTGVPFQQVTTALQYLPR